MAVLLAATTFPLIWVGGLVTSYDAGMAVPDWPGTYGYNLFLYPWQTWITGPWDLFIEHGHRLLGALAGLLTIAVVACTYRYDGRRWVRHYALGLLAAVILQGSLGGARVLLDDRQLAMIHGCFGPAFFAACVAMVVFTSRLWKDASAIPPAASSSTLPRLTIVMTALVYTQLVLGAVLRHVSTTASPDFFRLAVYGHLIFAGAVTIQVGVVSWLAMRVATGHRALRWPAMVMVALLACQLVLGCANWVVNYYWPNWVPDFDIVRRYTLIEAKGWWQTTIATAHAATGSLLLAMSVWLMVRGLRVLPTKEAAARVRANVMGGAAA
jgi:cytochrome c oxidase assembly protein subunit 15